jgi:ribosomal protein S18 acetylase RimI-like enzyme
MSRHFASKPAPQPTIADRPSKHEVLDASKARLGDEELESLIRDVYVKPGFTSAEAAATQFAAAAIRGRGQLLFVRDPGSRALEGTVIVVAPGSPACRVAVVGEAEMQLLAVREASRNAGIGRTLIAAALQRAQDDGHSRMVLRTQPSMREAHRLYVRAGFVRAPERDTAENGRTFLAYQRPL